MENDRYTVLAVDDDAINREVLSDMLAPYYDVQCLASGEAALEYIESGNEPDLMLLDIVMPGISGLDVMRTMNEKGYSRRIPVIMISSENPSEFENRAESLGASDYVSRPYDLAFLRKRIDNAIRLSPRETDRQDERIYRDALTGAKNRHYFNDMVINKTAGAVVIIDLDLFKTVNDRYGHLFGDEVLKATAKLIRSAIRNTDALVRYGGDEFVLVFSHIGADVLKVRLESLKEAAKQMTFAVAPDFHQTISVGAVVTDICDRDAMLRADRMLYKAKCIRDCVMIEG